MSLYMHRCFPSFSLLMGAYIYRCFVDTCVHFWWEHLRTVVLLIRVYLLMSEYMHCCFVHECVHCRWVCICTVVFPRFSCWWEHICTVFWSMSVYIFDCWVCIFLVDECVYFWWEHLCTLVLLMSVYLLMTMYMHCCYVDECVHCWWVCKHTLVSPRFSCWWEHICTVVCTFAPLFSWWVCKCTVVFPVDERVHALFFSFVFPAAESVCAQLYAHSVRCTLLSVPLFSRSVRKQRHAHVCT